MTDQTRIPTSHLTPEQAGPIAVKLLHDLATTVTKGFTAMSEQITHLQTSVDKELADDSAQNELIAELKAQLGNARDAATAAQAAQAQAEAGEADAVAARDQAQADLTAALDAADAAATKLDSNDAPADPPADPPVDNGTDEPPVV